MSELTLKSAQLRLKMLEKLIEDLGYHVIFTDKGLKYFPLQAIIRPIPAKPLSEKEIKYEHLELL